MIGSGGREHALAWKLAQSVKIQKVYVAPGNGGTALDSRLENVNITHPEELAEFAIQNDVSLTVVGPEAPLAAGIVNIFRAKNLKIFGPTKAAAQLESSKDFAKSFMERHGIPTAKYQTFSDLAAAHRYIDEQGAPIVIKADGLAAGKGVIVAMNLQQAHDAVDMMLSDNKPGLCRFLRQQQTGRCGCPGRYRGIPGRGRSKFYRSGGRQKHPSSGDEPGSQAFAGQ